MRKILIGSGLSPFDIMPYEKLIDLLHGNVGNLVYGNGVYRALMTEPDMELVSTNYRLDYSEEEIERFNSEFECFVIPMADSIRPGFSLEFQGLTRLVKALKIPSYVIGIGMQAPYEPGRDFRYPFDDDVRNYISAVLEKSTMIGVRGEMTADYLGRLGFQPERDFTVIGCPSMYTFGEKLELRTENLKLDESSKVSYCMSQGAPEAYIRFILDSAKSFEEAVFIPQRSDELKLMMTGKPYRIFKCAPANYPLRITHEVYWKGNARYFASAKSWADYLRTRELSFGTRMHGNVNALLAGTPAIFMPFDARTRELVKYHGFTHLEPEQIAQGGDLRNWIDKLDLNAPQKRQAQNFAHYVDFLDRNRIRHIYHDPDGGRCFDEKMATLDLVPPLKPLPHCEPELIAQQLNALNDEIWRWEQQEKKLQLKREMKKAFYKAKRKIRRIFKVKK